jgi:hypothetical protein
MTSFYPRGITLHEKLQRLAVEAKERPLTVDEGLRRIAVGTNDYGIPLLLLSLPGALPVPSLGLKSLLGAVVTLLGLQMFAGKRTPWLPDRFTGLRLRAGWIRRADHLGERSLPRLERFVEPRMNWMKYRLGSSLLGLAVIFLGLIMTLSIIPGSKMLAALVLLALSIGLIENDGLLTLLATLAAFILAALFAEAIYLLVIWLTA